MQNSVNIDGYEFNITEQVDTKIGTLSLHHWFIVDHSDRLAKYLATNYGGYENINNSDDLIRGIAILNAKIGRTISIKQLKEQIGIDYTLSDSNNLQNHNHPYADTKLSNECECENGKED